MQRFATWVRCVAPGSPYIYVREGEPSFWKFPNSASSATTNHVARSVIWSLGLAHAQTTALVKSSLPKGRARCNSILSHGIFFIRTTKNKFHHFIVWNFRAWEVARLDHRPESRKRARARVFWNDVEVSSVFSFLQEKERKRGNSAMRWRLMASPFPAVVGFFIFSSFILMELTSCFCCRAWPSL